MLRFTRFLRLSSSGTSVGKAAKGRLTKPPSGARKRCSTPELPDNYAKDILLTGRRTTGHPGRLEEAE